MRARFWIGALVLGPLLALAAPPAKKADPKDEDPPRTMARFYDLRVYRGSPPVYTHGVEEDVDSTPEACLSCHKKGTSGAPVTPHPEFPECRQCHVRRVTSATFKPTEWTSIAPPASSKRWLRTSPPVMPHDPTGFRVRCTTCHAGPHPVQELESKHAERPICVQCHVPAKVTTEWSRPAVAP
jgi:cytochrome c-type protein NapB